VDDGGEAIDAIRWRDRLAYMGKCVAGRGKSKLVERSWVVPVSAARYARAGQ